MDEPGRRELRAVRSDDPSLSPEANRILSEELREVIGRDAVEVPAGRAHTERARHGGRASLLVSISDNRVMAGSFFMIAVVVGVALSLTTGSWWFLPLAFGVGFVATMAVALLIINVTSETEHLSPSASARLEDEGVEEPDRVFSDLVAEFAPADGDRRDDGARDAVAQRGSVTPSRRSRPVGP
jgi:hypothetical protein